MAKAKKLSNMELASFFSQIAMLQEGNILLSMGIETMLEDTTNAEGKKLLTDIKEMIDNNQSLSSALKETGAFPDHTIHMLELGEESGKDADISRSLADYYDRQANISESIKNAVSYPLIMILMMIMVIIVLITKVLPIFSQVFEQLGSQMNAFSVSLMNFGSKLSSSSIALVIILTIAVLAIVFFAKVPQGKRLFSKFLDVFPPTVKFNDAIAYSRFASGLGMTFGRMDLYVGLDLVEQLVDNPRMSAKIEKYRAAMMDGMLMHDALREAGIFSSFHCRMIAVAEGSSHLEEALSKVSDAYDKEVDRRIRGIIAILEPTLVIILSLIVGMILLSVILPLMGIMSSIG